MGYSKADTELGLYRGMSLDELRQFNRECQATQPRTKARVAVFTSWGFRLRKTAEAMYQISHQLSGDDLTFADTAFSRLSAQELAYVRGEVDSPLPVPEVAAVQAELPQCTCDGDVRELCVLVRDMMAELRSFMVAWTVG